MDRFVATALAASFLGAALLTACDGEKPAGEEGLDREELGTFTTDTGGGIDFTVEPPADAVSALVYCGPYGYDRLATAESIETQEGSVVYDMEAPSGTAMRVGIHDDILPMLLPVSPALDLAGGAYAFRVFFDAEEAVSATCNAVYRIDGASGAPTVDLRLVFVGVDGIAPGLNAAEGESTMAPVLAKVAEMWGEARLSIGTVTYEDFSGDVDQYTILAGDEGLGSLLRTAGEDARAITFFFVQEITDDEGATILGLAGGPPGMAAVGGTSKSGVVVTTASFTSDPDEVARIMAHEGGHFLGLFHTTEKDGSSFDPLDDTPECSNDADGNGTFSTNECTGTGAENVMWWAASASSTGMSADQGWVLGRSAATR